MLCSEKVAGKLNELIPMLSVREKYLMITNCLLPLSNNIITSQDTINFRLLDGILDDCIKFSYAMSPAQTIEVARECTGLAQNKELNNKLRLALAKGEM